MDLNPTFKTPDGQSWTIELTTGLLCDVDDAVSFWLLDLVDPEVAKDVGPRKLFQLIVAACEPQWSKRGLSPVEFRNLFTSEESSFNAAKALEAAVVLFSHPSKRAILVPAMEKMERVRTATVKAATETALKAIEELDVLSFASDSAS